MQELEKPIGRVWRRMRFQRFLSALVWCWGVTLLLAAVAIAAEKLMHRPLPGADWWPFAIAGGLGVLVAGLIAAFTGASRVDAAVAIDRVFKLNERLSTALTLPDDLRESPAGRALLTDAIKHVADLDVGAEFGPRMPRRVWVPVLTGLMAVAMLFVPEMVERRAQAKLAEKFDQKALVDQTKALTKKLAQQREKLSQEKLADAEKLLAQIEKAADDLAKAPPSQKDKALVELNKLQDSLKERQKQIGSPEQINRQLQQLKDMAREGPAEEFAKNLANGDFMKAMQELKHLQEKLKSGKMTEEEKKALKNQIAEMSKQLEKLANLDQRKKQLEEALKNGGLSKEQFAKEMAKLEDQAKALKQMEKLAQKLDEVQKHLEKGDMKKAAEAMGMTEKQLNQMAQQLAEIEALDGAMADLQEAKEAMTGDGANQLGESMDNFGMGGRRKGMGNGLGRGRGQGDRPEAPDNTSTYGAKAKNQIVKGKAFGKGFTESSKTMVGKSVIEIQSEIETSEGLSADALTNQKVPKNVEKHIRGYFDQLNKGK